MASGWGDISADVELDSKDLNTLLRELLDDTISMRKDMKEMREDMKEMMALVKSRKEGPPGGVNWTPEEELVW